MHQICLLCERHVPDGNLFCQEQRCPAEHAPQVLSFADRLGDLTINRLVATLRTATLYEATQQEQRVLLKVAHPGWDHEQRLLREVRLLAAIQAARPDTPGLPTLLKPYTLTSDVRPNRMTMMVKVAGTDPADPHEVTDHEACGRAMLGDTMVRYAVFADVPGELLSDVLTKHPQLWLYHISYIAADLAAAVAQMHHNATSYLHGALSPESLYVHFAGKQGVPQVTLIDLGLVTPFRQRTDGSGYVHHWYPAAVRPAYAAPELAPDDFTTPPPTDMHDTAPAAATPATDVYGVGLTLYTMLRGGPAFPVSRTPPAAVYERVHQGQPAPLRRDDLKAIGPMIGPMIAPDPAHREPQTVHGVRAILHAQFGETPEPRRTWWPRPERVFAATVVLLGIAFLIAVILTVRALFA